MCKYINACRTTVVIVSVLFPVMAAPVVLGRIVGMCIAVALIINM
jgi:hypothetical protein